MSDETKRAFAVPDLELGVRCYLFIGCTGLVVLWLALSGDFGLLALLPVLMGALGLAPSLVPVDWKTVEKIGQRLPSYLMPPLMLIALVVLQVVFGYSTQGTFRSFVLSDLMIAAGLLAYFVAQYRLYGLRAAAVPVDTRPHPERGGGDEPDTRPAQLFRPRELRWPLIVLPLCVIVGQLLWRWIVASGEWNLDDDPPERLGMRETSWRLYSLVWLLGVGTLLLVGAGGIMRLYRMSGDEARLIGQDVLWTETRGEQRRVNRWLAWLRRKRARQAGELP